MSDRYLNPATRAAALQNLFADRESHLRRWEAQLLQREAALSQAEVALRDREHAALQRVTEARRQLDAREAAIAALEKRLHRAIHSVMERVRGCVAATTATAQTGSKAGPTLSAPTRTTAVTAQSSEEAALTRTAPSRLQPHAHFMAAATSRDSADAKRVAPSLSASHVGKEGHHHATALEKPHTSTTQPPSPSENAAAAARGGNAAHAPAHSDTIQTGPPVIGSHNAPAVGAIAPVRRGGPVTQLGSLAAPPEMSDTSTVEDEDEDEDAPHHGMGYDGGNVRRSTSGSWEPPAAALIESPQPGPLVEPRDARHGSNTAPPPPHPNFNLHLGGGQSEGRDAGGRGGLRSAISPPTASIERTDAAEATVTTPTGAYGWDAGSPSPAGPAGLGRMSVYRDAAVPQVPRAAAARYASFDDQAEDEEDDVPFESDDEDAEMGAGPGFSAGVARNAPVAGVPPILGLTALSAARGVAASAAAVGGAKTTVDFNTGGFSSLDLAHAGGDDEFPSPPIATRGRQSRYTAHVSDEEDW